MYERDRKSLFAGWVGWSVSGGREAIRCSVVPPPTRTDTEDRSGRSAGRRRPSGAPAREPQGGGHEAGPHSKQPRLETTGRLEVPVGGADRRRGAAGGGLRWRRGRHRRSASACAGRGGVCRAAARAASACAGRGGACRATAHAVGGGARSTAAPVGRRAGRRSARAVGGGARSTARTSGGPAGAAARTDAHDRVRRHHDQDGLSDRSVRPARHRRYPPAGRFPALLGLGERRVGRHRRQVQGGVGAGRHEGLRGPDRPGVPTAQGRRGAVRRGAVDASDPGSARVPQRGRSRGGAGLAGGRLGARAAAAAQRRLLRVRGDQPGRVVREPLGAGEPVRCVLRGLRERQVRQGLPPGSGIRRRPAGFHPGGTPDHQPG